MNPFLSMPFRHNNFRYVETVIKCWTRVASYLCFLLMVCISFFYEISMFRGTDLLIQ